MTNYDPPHTKSLEKIQSRLHNTPVCDRDAHRNIFWNLISVSLKLTNTQPPNTDNIEPLVWTSQNLHLLKILT